MTKKTRIYCLTFAILLCSQNLILAQSITLKDFVKDVWENNSDIKSQRIDLKTALLNIKAKSSIYDPGIHASIEKYHSQSTGGTDTLSAKIGLNNKLQTGADVALNFSGSKADKSTTPYGSDINISLSQPLTKGAGKNITEYQIETARLDEKIAQHNFIRISNSILINAISKYFDWLLSYKNKEIAEKNLEHAKFIYDENLKKETLKMATPYDVLEAKIAYKKAQDDKLIAQNNIKQHLASLYQYSGKNLADDMELLPTPTEIPTENITFTNDLLNNNPEILTSLVHLKKANNDIMFDVNQGLPATFIEGSFGYENNAGSYLDSLALSRQNYSIGLRLQYFLNNTNSEAAIDTDHLLLSQKQNAHDQLNLSLIIQAKNTIIDLKELKERMITAEEITQLSEEFVQIENKKFRLGLITTDKIVQDQNELNSARLNYNTIITNYLKSYYQLLTIKGELLNEFGLL